MAKAKSPKHKTGRGRGASGRGSPSSADNRTLARLRAQNRQLRASLREVEKERGTYRRAVYTWVEEEVSKLDLDRLLDRKGAVPFSQLIDEMKQELER